MLQEYVDDLIERKGFSTYLGGAVPRSESGG